MSTHLTPAQTPTHTGFIYSQSGRISHFEYADLLKLIAAQRYLVAMPDMPFNIAVVSPNQADAILTAHPEIEHWVIGGQQRCFQSLDSSCTDLREP